MAPEFDFDLSTYEAKQGFTPPPPGEYVAAVESSGFQPTNAGTGTMLKLVFQILEGPRKGDTIQHFLNVVNPSAKAEKIAREELKALFEAVGKVVTPKSRSEELHGLPLMITVGTRPGNDNREYAEIKRFKPYAKSGATAPAPSPAAQSSAAAETGAPPWNS